MFIDRAQVEFRAGNGGNGVVAWRREKYLPKGGPYGGNGGPGGSVIIEASVQVPSLDFFRNRRLIKAENGGAGGSNCRQGKKGQDLIIQVPLGTLVKDAETGDLIADMTEDKQRLVLCRGGKGGLGNNFFKTPTNRAPNHCTPGKKGGIRKVELELKMIADVGLIGFPNAGKSTLIESLANIRVKTAAYPFTTLKPNIGFIEFRDGSRIFIADIPGIIEGAHENRGLGLEFLRHIERTKLLLFILDTSGIDGRKPEDDYRVLRNEINAYSSALNDYPYLIVLNKCDTDEAKANLEAFYKAVSPPPEKTFEVSAISGENLDQLIEAIAKMTPKVNQEIALPEEEAFPEYPEEEILPE